LNDAGGQGYDLVSAINSKGDSVGYSWIPNSSSAGHSLEAVYWNASGASTVLTTLLNAGDGDSEAAGINDAGLICGVSNDKAVIWSNTGAILWSSPDQDSAAYAINKNGATVGQDGTNQAYWSPTGTETLLDNPILGSQNENEVIALNAFGESIGGGFNPEVHHWTAMKWSDTGAVTVLQELPGGIGDDAYAINADGGIVGYCQKAGKYATTDVATYWEPDGKAIDLQTILGPGWNDTVADGINNAGDICGNGRYHGLRESFLLIPVKGGAMDSTHYVESHQNVLAASAIHAHARS